MRGFILGIAPIALTAIAAGTAAAGPSAQARELCVGARPGCFATIQSAIDAANDGDTIRIAAGTFAGGITVNKSVNLIGEGAQRTTIKGGGPVLTIGQFFAAMEPTVSISRVTITGGVTHSSAQSVAFVGKENVIALGGGIEVPPAADFAPGATVTISKSVITRNRVAPTETLPLGPPCPDGPCPFAGASGGGIDTWGNTTLLDTTVSDNEAAGAVTSDAVGGGIYSHGGAPLTLDASRVVGNDAVVTIPNGRFAEGGGIFFQGGAELRITNSDVNDNTARLTSNLPSFAGDSLIDMNANSGAIHVGDGGSVAIEGSSLSGNFVSANDPRGEANAFDAAMLVGDSSLVMRNTVVSGNGVSDTVKTSADIGPGGTALEVDGGGTITGTRITGNLAEVISPEGDAAASGGVAVFNFADHPPKLLTVQQSVISGNTAIATSRAGTATVHGAGVYNNSLLVLRDVRVTENVGKATAPTGVAQGGGIWNGAELSGPPVELTLDSTTVTRNVLRGSAGITLQGGGLFTTFPVQLTNSRIAENTPDQCFGC